MIHFFYKVNQGGEKVHGILFGTYQQFDKNAKSSIKKRIAKMMSVRLSTLSWLTEEHYREGMSTPDFRTTYLRYTDPATREISNVGWEHDIDFFFKHQRGNEKFYDFCITEVCEV